MKKIFTPIELQVQRPHFFSNQVVFLLGILMLPLSMKAQTKAVIDENYSIVLDVNQPLDKDYTIDLTNLEIHDEPQFLSLFKMMNDNSIVFTIDLENRQMFIKIMYETPMGTPMSVVKWNEHLSLKLRRSKMAVKMN